MTHRALALAFALLLTLPPLASAAERAQPGLWEVSVQVELPGVSPPPPTTQTECLSQKDVEADPVPSLDKGACRATDVRRSGDKVTWKVVCEGPLPGRGEGEITYQSPTAYDGWMTLETGGAVVRATLKARRLGGC